LHRRRHRRVTATRWDRLDDEFACRGARNVAPGSAAIPAPHKDRAVNAYESGKRIVDMVWEDLRPSKIMTREAFENVIVVNSAIGGSTQRADSFQCDRAPRLACNSTTTTGRRSATTYR
jgi:hypothetical protein